MMKLQIFTKKKLLRWNLIILSVISLDSPLKKDKNCYLQVFFKSVNALKKILGTLA